jgi:hypothetical protein
MSRSLDDFVAVSAALTGYSSAELLGTGMARTYLGHVMAIVGESFAARWLEVGHDVVRRSGHDLRLEIELRLLDDPDFGPVARNVIVLWYTGQWVQLPGPWRDRHGANPADVDAILSPDSYTEGLVWDAIGAHPQGAKAPGFATWVTPPAAGSSNPSRHG